MKVKIISNTDKVLATIELRQKKFSSGSHGYWGTAKAIDWDQKKYFQVNAYAVEIGSKVSSKTKTKTKVERAGNQNQEQNQLKDSASDKSAS